MCKCDGFVGVVVILEYRMCLLLLPDSFLYFPLRSENKNSLQIYIAYKIVSLSRM